MEAVTSNYKNHTTFRSAEHKQYNVMNDYSRQQRDNSNSQP